MPSRYVIRQFEEGAFYHVFNRGVEKRNIFLDEQDYNMFLYYLFVYITPLEQVLIKYPLLPVRLYNKNLHGKIDLISFCLMPNHFHFLLRQESIDGVRKLLKQITNAYTLYFNNKYQRVGGLVQGRYKAVMIETDELLIHVSRYIHLNPVVSGLVEKPESYKWSNYLEYLGGFCIINCSIDFVLSYFSSKEKYKRFVDNQIDYAKKLEKIKHLTFDD